MEPVDLLLRAVRHPQTLQHDDAAACLSSGDTKSEPARVTRMRLGALVTLVYARPDLLDSSTVQALGAESCWDHDEEGVADLVSAALRGLMGTTLAHEAVERVTELLLHTTLSEPARHALLDALEHAALWRRELLDTDSLLALAGSEHLRPHRERLLARVVEPCLLRDADSVNADQFERFARLSTMASRPPYALALLAARPQISPPARKRAVQAIGGHFPLAGSTGKRLRQGHLRVLVVHNVDDAQGDEMVRVMPLLQALLDANPATHATILTDRRYLYAHPRLKPVAIHHAPAVHAALQEHCDILVDFYQPALSHSFGLELAVLEYARAQRPFLFLGCGRADERFVYDRVEIDGIPRAEELGLDHQRVPNVYETSFRLLTELGLPLRSGEMAPDTPVLAGLPCAKGEELWNQLTAGNSTRRPVALVNPFGGYEALKGYGGRTLPALARRLSNLIADGYFLVILPSGREWGGRDSARAVVNGLDPNERGFVAVAPVPEPSGRSAVCACEPVPLPQHSSLMRHFFQLARRADSIVAVEGWAIHAAYMLGKPYRVLTLPHSIPVPWLPHGTTHHQTMASPVDVESCGVADGVAEPPLEEQPRSMLLCSVLKVLGACSRQEALPPLRAALSSEDRHLRLEAARALGSFDGEEIDELMLHCLDDTCGEVRAAAASRLLSGGRDWSSELGPHSEEMLRAHVIIGTEKSDWAPLWRVGEGTRTALRFALQDDSAWVQRQARGALRLLDYYRQTPPASASGSRTERMRARLPSLRIQKHRFAARDQYPSILILTPIKDASDQLDLYCTLLHSLSYPRDRLSLGLVEGDSADGTYEAIKRRLPRLRHSFDRVGLWKRDFSYRLPKTVVRGDVAIQMERRSVLARSRNYLLAQALGGEEWVLWLDSDLIEYPPDIIQQLLSSGKDVVTPHCVLEFGGRSFDRNSWRDRGALYLDDLRQEGDAVPLHGVGGTMLLVRADLHRKGLHFPESLYGAGNPLCRDVVGEIETEGLGIMAHDMGYRCWGLPNLEIRHRDG